MKTHKVLDTVYTVEEGQECFCGTLQECNDFVAQQDTIGLVVVTMTKAEIEQYEAGKTNY